MNKRNEREEIFDTLLGDLTNMFDFFIDMADAVDTVNRSYKRASNNVKSTRKSTKSREEREEERKREIIKKYPIEKVIFNEPATIVVWKDGTRTIAKCDEDEKFDKEKGFVICLCKKYMANNFAFKTLLDHYCE